MVNLLLQQPFTFLTGLILHHAAFAHQRISGRIQIQKEANNLLLSQMDKATQALSLENHKVCVERNQNLLTGEDSFIKKFFCRS